MHSFSNFFSSLRPFSFPLVLFFLWPWFFLTVLFCWFYFRFFISVPVFFCIWPFYFYTCFFYLTFLFLYLFFCIWPFYFCTCFFYLPFLFLSLFFFLTLSTSFGIFFILSMICVIFFTSRPVVFVIFIVIGEKHF